ncbi:pentatricopeptide repeat-containing protein chloroplastic, partial [Nannochloropsis gaditana]
PSLPPSLPSHLSRGIVLDVKSYNALLPAVLAEAPPFLQQEAVETFLGDLSRRGFAPDRVTFNTILKHHASMGKEALALETLRMMKDQAGIVPDVVSFTTVITACGRDWDGAMRVLAQAEQESGVEKDARMYTAAMRVCANAGRRREVLELFERMKAMQATQEKRKGGKERKGEGESEEDRLSVLIAYNAVLEALKTDKEWRQALQVLQEMRRVGLVPNVVNHNTVMDAIAEAGEAGEALALLKQMKVSRVPADKRTYTAAIKAMIKSADVLQGRELFEEMCAAGITPDAVTYTTLMELYGQAGNKEQMEELVQQMSRKRGFPRDVRAFTAVIRAYGRAGLWREALELLGTMKARNVKPTVVSYGTAMAALAASGRHVEAFELLEAMKREGVEPNQVVLEWATEACRTAGRLDKVVQLQWKKLTA